MCSSGSSTTVQKADPWVGVQPYLTGRPGVRNPLTGQTTGAVSGIYPEAQRLYGDQGWTPEMQSLTDTQQQTIQNRTGGQVDRFNTLSNGLSGGQYDPNVQRVGGTTARMIDSRDTSALMIDPRDTTASMVDPRSAFASMGGANPMQSIRGMLSGQANTATLDPVVNTAMRRMGENFNEQVMPGINQGAVAAGQYGGSRQGIAQGLAAKGLAYSMGDTASNMYNQAYQQAQQNMYGTANNMAGLGLSNSTNNADRDFQSQTNNANRDFESQSRNANLDFQSQTNNANRDLEAQSRNANLDFQSQSRNADISLANNSQAMQNSGQQVQNRLLGLQTMQGGNALNDQAYNQQMGLNNARNDYNWNNLNRYASIVQPGSGIGGTTTSSTSGGGNGGAGLLGGALAGAQLGGMFGSAGMGAGLGGLLALSDRRAKTDIEAVGKLDNDLTVYRYRYKAGGPLMLGVMADEVKQVKPHAVTHVDGLDYVNYGAL